MERTLVLHHYSSIYWFNLTEIIQIFQALICLQRLVLPPQESCDLGKIIHMRLLVEKKIWKSVFLLSFLNIFRKHFLDSPAKPNPLQSEL